MRSGNSVMGKGRSGPAPSPSLGAVGSASVRNTFPCSPTHARPLVPRPFVWAAAPSATTSAAGAAPSARSCRMPSCVEFTSGTHTKWSRCPLGVSTSTPVMPVAPVVAARP